MPLLTGLFGIIGKTEAVNKATAQRTPSGLEAGRGFHYHAPGISQSQLSLNYQNFFF